MTKVKKLSFVFMGLLLVSLVLNWAGKEKKISSVDKGLFAITDTTQISRLVIESSEGKISIAREKDQWRLNDQYAVDPQLIYLAQRILNAVQTQRPVSASNFEGIKSDLQRSGKKVTVQLTDGEERIFYAGGNAAKTSAYFADKDLAYIYTVVIPGYKSYLSGIFELTLNQWRDRVLFASSWRTLQKLMIDYAQINRTDLSISFDKKFLAVKGVSQLDTAALMNYLQPLEHFQVNDYLEKGSFPRYDSLLGVPPLANLKLEDIDQAKNRTLKIYPKMPGEQFYLVTNGADEMMVVDARRMEILLSEPVVFQAK